METSAPTVTGCRRDCSETRTGRGELDCVEDGVLLLLLVPPSIKVVDEVTAEVVDGTMQRFERALANSRLLVAFARRWLSLV